MIRKDKKKQFRRQRPQRPQPARAPGKLARTYEYRRGGEFILLFLGGAEAEAERRGGIHGEGQGI